jgi:hypothetical protein
MNPHVERRLSELRSDYQERTGQPFQCFYCPILNVDQSAPLQMGHIIRNNNQLINIFIGKFDMDSKSWRYKSDRKPLIWPKSSVPYSLNIVDM